MFAVKSKFHQSLWFAQKVSVWDLFRIVTYVAYKGDVKSVPFYFKKHKGNSCETDLTQEMEAIFNAMRRDTRKRIRRAEKEGCTVEIVEDLGEYVDFHNSFCQKKGLDLFMSSEKLQRYGKLLITKSMHNGVVLSMLATVLDEQDRLAVSLLSASRRFESEIDRNMIGWGNRLLRIKTLELLKQRGFSKYDWGGVCMDENDPRYSITDFKLSFGGVVIDSWILESPAYVICSKLRSFARRLFGRSHAE